MEQRQMGKTDLVCSTVGFGTWEMAGRGYGEIDVNEAERAVHASMDHGINLFDTAEVYGPFTSEELLAKSLGSRRNEVIIVDKVGFGFNEDEQIIGLSSKPESIVKRTEGCLKRLKTDMIDLMLIHWPDHVTPLDEVMAALEQLKGDGKIRYYGVSNFSVEMMKECNEHGSLATNQVGYHLFDQRMDAEVLPYCQENQIGFMSYGTLGFGLLTGAFTPETTFDPTDWRSYGSAFGLSLFKGETFEKELKVGERLAEVAAGYDKSIAQLAIAWVLGNPAVTVALVGMRNDRELEENVAAADWRLSESDRAEIDRIFEEEGLSRNIDVPQALSPF